MDEYKNTLKALQEMESRYNDGFSTLDRSLLDSLYYQLFGREISNRGCGDCYRDAYMEIKIKLRKDKAMPMKCDYKLKAGAVISFFGESIAYANPNLTNDVAERYLAKNIDNAKMFSQLPDNWKERVNEYVSLNNSPDNIPVAETLPEAIKLLKQRDSLLAEANAKLEAKEKEIADLNGTISSLETALKNSPSSADAHEAESEVEAIRLELASANDTIEADKEEIERLKAELATIKESKKTKGKSKDAPADE